MEDDDNFFATIKDKIHKKNFISDVQMGKRVEEIALRLSIANFNPSQMANPENKVKTGKEKIIHNRKETVRNPEFLYKKPTPKTEQMV